MPPTVEELAEMIRSDEPALTENVLLTGTPFVFESTPETWTAARAQLAGDLAVAEDEIYIVGSAKMGYSLAPRKFGSPFHDESDIDCAVVSARLFDEMWLSILDWHYRRRHRLPPSDREWDARRREELYWGYINPIGFNFRGLTRSRTLRPAKTVSTTWFAAFQQLGGLIPELAGRRVNGRLYRTIEHTIMYHDHGFRQVKRSLVDEDG